MAEEKVFEEKLEESQNQKIEEREQIVDEVKRESFGNKLWSGLKNTAKKAGDGIKAGVDKVHDWNKERKAIRNATETFEVVSDGTKVRMFRNIEEQSLYFKVDDKNANKLKSKTVLLNTEDNSEIQILEVDKKTTYYKDLKLEDKDNEPHIKEIPCFKATYKNYEKPIIPVNQTINNTQKVIIDNGATFNGDIVQNNYIDKLNEIELAINSYKPNFINKGKKQKQLNYLVILKIA